MSKRKNQKPMKSQTPKRHTDNSTYAACYYLTALVVIIVLPIILLVIYNEFAGGLLAGVWYYYEPQIIDADFMEWIVNPLVMLVGYGTFLFVSWKYFRQSRTGGIRRICRIGTFVATSVVVAAVLCWPLFVGSTFPTHKVADWVQGEQILWPDK